MHRSSRRRRRAAGPSPEFVECANKGALDDLTRPAMFGGYNGSGIQTTTREEEYEYFERLGPMVRRVLDERCFYDWSSLDVLREMHKRKWDPMKRAIDRQMAEEIVAMDTSAKTRSSRI